jgi:hypothetical protein
MKPAEEEIFIDGKGRGEKTLQFAQRAKFRGAAAGVGGDLVVRRRDGTARERLSEFDAKILWPGVSGALGLAAHPAKKLFRRTILE